MKGASPLSLGALVLLAACGGPDRSAPLNPDLPGEVVARLPLDVDLNQVNRDVNGCYFYTYAASIFLVKDDAGNPLCIPRQ